MCCVQEQMKGCFSEFVIYFWLNKSIQAPEEAGQMCVFLEFKQPSDILFQNPHKKDKL